MQLVNTAFILFTIAFSVRGNLLSKLNIGVDGDSTSTSEGGNNQVIDAQPAELDDVKRTKLTDHQGEQPRMIVGGVPRFNSKWDESKENDRMEQMQEEGNQSVRRSKRAAPPPKNPNPNGKNQKPKGKGTNNKGQKNGKGNGNGNKGNGKKKNYNKSKRGSIWSRMVDTLKKWLRKILP